MKRIFYSLIAALMLGAGSAAAFDPKDLLKGVGGSSSSSESTENSSSGNILGSLGNMVSNVIANKNFSIDDLTGSWAYSSPAVSFESENILKKAGGAAAASTVQNQLAPYYKKLGLDKSSLVVNADHTFTLKLGLITLKGTAEKDADNNLVFKFSAFGKVKLGELKAHATKSGSTLNLTFDATKLIALLTKVSSSLNISTLKTLGNLLSSYEGIYIGFQFKAA